MHRRSSRPADDDVIRQAAAHGFDLVEYETSIGQVVFEWRRGHEPRPQFVSRRVAMHWMVEWLQREDAHA